MKKVQKGFTLVELIVVITILAILGTIAFISLQGYSQDARNSKITADLRSLTSAIETSITDGTITLGSLVTNTGSYTANQVSGDYGSGVTIGTDEDSYQVGEIDFTALRQSGEEFNYADGTDTREYIVGVLTDNDVDGNNKTDDSYVVYQVAGQIPLADGENYEAVVKGNWYSLPDSNIEGVITTAADTDDATPEGVKNGDQIGGGLY